LFCYAHAIAILRGYERIKWGDEKQVPDWAKLPEINPNILRNSTAHHTQESAVEKTQELPLKANMTKENSTWLTGKPYRKRGWL
ncbi:phage terminase large subunit family protein, partial [Gallibacterium anatis]